MDSRQSANLWKELVKIVSAATDWAFLTRGEFRPRIPTCCRTVDWSRIADVRMPTDDRGSLLPFLRLDYAVPTL